MIQSIIEVSLQGSDSIVNANTIEIDLGVAPIQPHPVTTKDEVDVDALLAQPISEVDIQRIKIIYGATEFVPLDAMKVRLEFKKRIDVVFAPQPPSNIFKVASTSK